MGSGDYGNIGRDVVATLGIFAEVETLRTTDLRMPCEDPLQLAWNVSRPAPRILWLKVDDGDVFAVIERSASARGT